MKRYQFYIKGLHCASCVYTTEKALKKIKGVEKAVVNLNDGQALVESREPISWALIEKKIKSVGYQALFFDKNSNQEKIEREKIKELKELKNKTILGLIASLIILWVTMPGIKNLAPIIFRNYWFQLVIAAFAQFYLGLDFYRMSFSALKNRMVNMETLIILGTSSSFIYSLIVVIFSWLNLEPYFDVSVVIISLVLLGRYLETKAKGKTSEAIKKLMNLSPKKARILIKVASS